MPQFLKALVGVLTKNLAGDAHAHAAELARSIAGSLNQADTDNDQGCEYDKIHKVSIRT